MRRNRWTGIDADAAYGLLNRLPIKAVSDRRHLDRAWELSRRYDNHPVYDMLYAAAAEAVGTLFITADETLLLRLKHLAWGTATRDLMPATGRDAPLASNVRIAQV